MDTISVTNNMDSGGGGGGGSSIDTAESKSEGSSLVGSLSNLSITPLITSPVVPSSPSVQPKKKSIDDFNIGKVLGEGSYGAVVLGTDKETNSQYAIKILEKKHIIKENKIKYVQIEKEIFCKCNHPNIVKLFFTFRSDACLYYVLELCSQGDLLHQLKKVGSFDYESTQYYIAEIISAIEHLHNLGIVHRDLKPENILMSSDMHIKITDFGTGKILDKTSQLLTSASSSSSSLSDSITSPNTSTGNLEQIIPPNDNSENNVNNNNQVTTKVRANSFVGTAEYVSPELISNKETSTDSDLWALGCILYQLSTGRLPFRGKTEFLTFQKVSNRDLVYPLNINPVIKDLIEKLLVMKPTDRLGSKTSVGGFENLKKHEFFNGIDWDSLYKLPPPPIQAPKEKIQFDDSALLMESGGGGAMSPLNHSSSSSGIIGQSASNNTSGSNSAITSPLTSSTNNLNNNNNNNTILNSNSNSSSSLRSPSSMSNGNSISVSIIEKLSKFLNQGEHIVEQGLVWKRKGFSIKKRHLVLTSTPRLIYIDPKKMEVRGEIPWSSSIKPEVKGNSNFVIQTPKRKYNMEDTEHNPQKWVDAITNILNNNA